MQNLSLDRSSRRVIGVLIEKELSTPNLYPLSVNALTNGCNQRSSRNPVLTIREFEVEGVLRQLFLDGWTGNVTQPGGRVLKWKHRFGEKLDLEKAELAVMAELFLRGPQQPGELRSNANRLHPIATQEDLQATLDKLQAKSLVQLNEQRPGERTRRWDHRFWPEAEQPEFDAGEASGDEATTVLRPRPAPEVAARPVSVAPSAVSALEVRLAALEARLAALEGLVAGQQEEDREPRPGGFGEGDFA